jgi:tRNA pseudouridine32 synthase/23S rRNA pseudouridine746 synthase
MSASADSQAADPEQDHRCGLGLALVCADGPRLGLAAPREASWPAVEGVRLVHVDAHLIACDKPAGLLAVPGRGADKADCLAARVQARFPDALVVHRLDQATSGLMLFARGFDMQRRLGAAFEARQVHKTYEALLAGRLGTDVGEQGTVDLPLGADWPNRPRQQVDHEHGRPALTHWTLLGHEAWPPLAASRVESSAEQPMTVVSRVALHPVTGRSHQLRVHMASLGHAILGDALYADEHGREAAPRLLLHARALAFNHPASGQPLLLGSRVPF